jgi:hypothetical protein
MEITGNGEVKGLDSAQGMPMFAGPRPARAMMFDKEVTPDVTCEGRYMGETNPVRGLTDYESYGPMTDIRNEGTYDGSWKIGEFPK